MRRRDQPLKDAEGYISDGLSDTQYVKLSYIKETIRRMDVYVKENCLHAIEKSRIRCIINMKLNISRM